MEKKSSKLNLSKGWLTNVGKKTIIFTILHIKSSSRWIWPDNALVHEKSFKYNCIALKVKDLRFLRSHFSCTPGSLAIKSTLHTKCCKTDTNFIARLYRIIHSHEWPGNYQKISSTILEREQNIRLNCLEKIFFHWIISLPSTNHTAENYKKLFEGR